MKKKDSTAANKALLSPENTVTDETTVRYMMRLAGPMVLTTMTFTMMQFVDRIMVSRLGTAALAAILPAAFIGAMPAGFLMGVLASVATFVSQSFGRGRKNDCASYCWQGIYMGLVYSVVTGAIMWPLAPAIFKMLGHSPDVVTLEVIYFRIMLYVNIAAVFIWACSEFFIGIHRPAIIMHASITAQIVNIIASYVLIFGKLGFPAMGIAGAGWGTFIGATVGAGMRVVMFVGKGMNSEYNSIGTMKTDFQKMWDLLKIGFPAGLEIMQSMALWGIILVWLVGRFGTEATAATSAVLSCTNLSTMPIVGVRIALTAAVGKSIGAGRKDDAITQTQNCLRVAIVFMGLVGLGFFVFRNSLMHLWTHDNEVIALGVELLICAAIYQIFAAAQGIYSGALRGAGDTLWLAIASAAGAIVVLGAGGLATVKFFPQLGALGPWIAATLSIIVIGLANRHRFKSNKWQQIDLFRREVVVETVEA